MLRAAPVSNNAKHGTEWIEIEILGDEILFNEVIFATCRGLGGNVLPTDPSEQLVTRRFPVASVARECLLDVAGHVSGTLGCDVPAGDRQSKGYCRLHTVYIGLCVGIRSSHMVVFVQVA